MITKFLLYSFLTTLIWIFTNPEGFGSWLVILFIFYGLEILFGPKPCSYCHEHHRSGNKYYNSRVGKSKKFGSLQCLRSWEKENYICMICDKFGPYEDTTIQHKFKRNYYYFCSKNCKDIFRDKNPDLFFMGVKRHSISSDLRKIVFNRDGGKCVKCGSKENIHFDHIIPVSKGGSTTLKNLELLCQDCNLSKSDNIE
tara:strand:+ start:162 stop:755 length:594 start_codon:yes stop_codon:yes gene_type:complete